MRLFQNEGERLETAGCVEFLLQLRGKKYVVVTVVILGP